MFAKSLNELTASDIKHIIGRVEDEQIEFKEDLATRDGHGSDGTNRDPWHEGKDFGKQARRDIAKELVAFANTSGGTLILGVSEDGEKRASQIVPIPRCRELADRLAASIAATTDPKLTSLEYAGVEINGDAGVVVFRIGQSHRAPHRDTDSLQCYYRAGDRSEPMPMRSIQDLAVQRAMGSTAVIDEFDRRSVLLDGMRLKPQLGPMADAQRLMQVCQIRATAMPLERIYLSDIHSRKSLLPRALAIKTRDGAATLTKDLSSKPWLPILRGWSKRDEAERRSYGQLIRADGLVECRFDCLEYIQEPERTQKGVPLTWILGPIVQLLVLTECFRTKIGRPELEYAMDFEWRFPISSALLMPEWHVDDDALSPLQTVNRVSDYQLPRNEAFSTLLGRIENDIVSSFGASTQQLVEVNFEMALHNAML